MNNTEIFSEAEATGDHVSGLLFSHASIARFARWAAQRERERILGLLDDMQRQVGDRHNYYAVAANRIREGV